MAEIFTKKGEKILVDDEDYERLNAYSWHLSGGYAYRNAPHPIIRGARTKISMHREVLRLEFGDPREGDHKFGNKLDNRKSELRICAQNENKCNRRKSRNNTSGFKGVTWNKSTQRWHARVQFQGKDIHLGEFDDPKIAHHAYEEGAKRYHGEFASAA